MKKQHRTRELAISGRERIRETMSKIFWSQLRSEFENKVYNDLQDGTAAQYSKERAIKI